MGASTSAAAKLMIPATVRQPPVGGAPARSLDVRGGRRGLRSLPGRFALPSRLRSRPELAHEQGHLRPRQAKGLMLEVRSGSGRTGGTFDAFSITVFPEVVAQPLRKPPAQAGGST